MVTRLLPSACGSSQNWVKRGNSSGQGWAVSIATPRADRPYWSSSPELRKYAAPRNASQSVGGPPVSGSMMRKPAKPRSGGRSSARPVSPKSKNSGEYITWRASPSTTTWIATGSLKKRPRWNSWAGKAAPPCCQRLRSGRGRIF